jgi:hypothetical protein
VAVGLEQKLGAIGALRLHDRQPPGLAQGDLGLLLEAEGLRIEL